MAIRGLDASLWVKVNQNWKKVAGAKDLGLPLSKEEIDCSGRFEYKKYLPGQKDAPIDFDMEVCADEAFEALENSFLTNTYIHCLFIDNAKTATPVRGFEADFHVTKFEETNGKSDEALVSVSLRLAADSAIEPTPLSSSEIADLALT